jgi:hypothetical protein
MNKAHSYNFDDTFNCKGKSEKMTSLLNELISRKLVVSIVVLITSHENGVYENHEHNKVVEHWPTNQLNGSISQTVAFVQAKQGVFVEHYKFLVLFEFVSSACKLLLLRTHGFFTDQFHFFVLKFSSGIFVTCFGEILHIFCKFFFFFCGVHVLFFFQSPFSLRFFSLILRRVLLFFVAPTGQSVISFGVGFFKWLLNGSRMRNIRKLNVFHSFRDRRW